MDISQQIILLQDSSLNIAHPALSPNGDYLFFVSDMSGGHGGKDIWKVERTKRWMGIPKNLGETINTAGDEMFPCLKKKKMVRCIFLPMGILVFKWIRYFKAEPSENK